MGLNCQVSLIDTLQSQDLLEQENVEDVESDYDQNNEPSDESDDDISD